jgi:3-deoxy-D-manno-octulosonate 8-phosphate phosphatase (KDO 8-P phosphatase)
MIFQQDKEQILSLAQAIKLLLLDVDGVLTDGKLYVGESGEQLKVFNTLDGHGIKLLQKAGIQVGIISGRDSAALLRRASELGIGLLYRGREDKAAVLQEIISNLELGEDEVAYAGDDLPDLAVIDRVGLGISVPNAHPEVRNAADMLTESRGGEGAVREICDFLLQANGLYEQIVIESLGQQPGT